ncbi:hypothetical protein, partial [Escherichia coli]|uniref:hypothetical protein n=1 Tax=Escherichia coli TaxID=562 RepID=UPI0002A1C927
NESLIGQSTTLNMAVVSTSGAVDVSGDNKCVTASISDLLVVVMKKATAGITIS